MKLADDSLKKIFKDHRHRSNLEALFKEFKCDISPTGLQELLFEVRGALHHYYGRSTKRKGTPFNQREFESISLLVMELCTVAIYYRIVEINRSKDKL